MFKIFLCSVWRNLSLLCMEPFFSLSINLNFSLLPQKVIYLDLTSAAITDTFQISMA